MLAENALLGAGLGTGAVVLGLPLLGRILRPTAKALIKGGILVYREAADIVSTAMEETSGVGRLTPNGTGRPRAARTAEESKPAVVARGRRGGRARKRQPS